ncbi:MAG: NADH-quinone oxidoreductase subunit NuoH [Chitinophagales bacterium]|nr:NADH-quinone oxidoreductase subunit NuoH [Chitinophagales bacterium]MDW8273513.1 NADH-quinone oxidoreductase subunit NuoH [Chitinophagales bacterium]
MDTVFFVEKGTLILIIWAITMLIALYSTFGERVFAAYFQDRRGPNRAGPGGLLQPLADGVKMFTKEDFIPNTPNKLLFIFGPAMFMTTALLTSSVIPWGGKLHIFGYDVWLHIADVNVALLFVFGVVSIGVYGIMIGGWASNNKYSLLGAVRASSQMISYEIAMGLSIIALLLLTGTLSIREIAEQQGKPLFGISGLNWNIFYQPLGFLIFLVCAFAETNRTPFDLPECEAELIGGYHTEYSSMKLGFYLFAEYINMFISSAVLATLYFGSYNYPGMGWVAEHIGPNISTIIGVFVLFAKILFFIFLYMWVRWTVPRFRYDQLMNLGWKTLIPLALLNIFITGCAILFFN